ncbi:MAG: hypothetical protein LBV19_00200 [Streptococcaceae bacterium]|jgi:hypothetical protein|nr:hypothetical protein [Streptococcaceae bacterium]
MSRSFEISILIKFYLRNLKENFHGKLHVFRFLWLFLFQYIFTPIIYASIAKMFLPDDIFRLIILFAGISIFWLGLGKTTQDLRRNKILDTYKILGVEDICIVSASEIINNSRILVSHFIFIVTGIIFVSSSHILFLFLGLMIFVVSFGIKLRYLKYFYSIKGWKFRFSIIEKVLKLDYAIYFAILLGFADLSTLKNYNYKTYLLFGVILCALIAVFSKTLRKAQVVKYSKILSYYLIEVKIAFIESGGVISGVIFSLVLGPILIIVFLVLLSHNYSYILAGMPESQVFLLKYILCFMFFEILQKGLLSVFAYDVERWKMVKNQYLGELWVKKFQAKTILYMTFSLPAYLITTLVVVLVDRSFALGLLLFTLFSTVSVTYNQFFTVFFHNFKKLSFPYASSAKTLAATSIAGLIDFVPLVIYQKIMPNTTLLLFIVTVFSVGITSAFYILSMNIIKDSSNV